MTVELEPLAPMLELPSAVHSAGFAVADPDAVIAALSQQHFADVPEQAVAKRRAEFMAGRFAARQALRGLGLEGAPGRNSDGSPRWPERAVGSITHGAQRALCVVAWRDEIVSLGIDAERLLAESSERALLRRICSETELSVLATAIAAPEAQLVSIAFSAKESLYKCLHPLVQRFMGFDAARVVDVSPQPGASESAGGGVRGTLTFELSQDWSATFRSGQRFTAAYTLAPTHVETAVVLAA